MVITRAVNGPLSPRRSISEDCLRWKTRSSTPAFRKSIHLEIPWNNTSTSEATTVTGVPTAPIMIIRASRAMVEWASIRLKLSCDKALMAEAIKTKPVRPMITMATGVSFSAGDKRSIIKGAIFTMVEECSKALTGVGATMAPSSHLLKGSCAPLIKAAILNRASGSRMPSACACASRLLNVISPYPL